MPYVLLALAIFAALVGSLYTYRFLMFVAKKVQFSSLGTAFLYAFMGAVLLATAAWILSAAIPGLVGE